jgi:hypothetical protein
MQPYFVVHWRVAQSTTAKHCLNDDNVAMSCVTGHANLRISCRESVVSLSSFSDSLTIILHAFVMNGLVCAIISVVGLPPDLPQSPAP